MSVNIAVDSAAVDANLELEQRMNLVEMEQRIDENLVSQQQRIYQNTDRMFAWLMLIQWLAGIAFALIISPKAWSGITSQTHIHVWSAIFLGGLISSLPILLAFVRPGLTSTRHVIAVAQMLMSALLIHLTGGRIETHFHVFGSLAFLAFYRDWRVLLSASTVVGLDHYFRGVYWPASVYGVLTTSQWRWLEHAAWVLFEDLFLIRFCLQGLSEMRFIATQQAQAEVTNQILKVEIAERKRAKDALQQAHADLEIRIQERTAALINTNHALQSEIVERNRAEEALVKSEERYALAARGANDGLWDWDLKNNTIYFSSRWKYLIGFKDSDNCDGPNSWFDRIHPEDIDQVKQAIDNHLTGIDPHFESEHRVLHSDGSYRWMLKRGFVMRDQHKQPYRMAGSLTDITKRKKTEEELRLMAIELEARVAERTEELARMNDDLSKALQDMARINQELISSQKRADRIFSALADILPGTILDEKYRLEEKIGTGGFGVVYRAIHLILGRSVAIKIFRPSGGNDFNENLERFRREGISACRVLHPNAVSILDSGVSAEGIAYLVMELLEGFTLTEELNSSNKLSLLRCASIVIPICSVLAEAHNANIVHRDIKPDNIFMHQTKEGEVVKVVDFGIAKLMGDINSVKLETLTQSGLLVGTPAYMSPERITAKPYDGKSDIYSLGIMIYQMLSGELPFQTLEASPLPVMFMHLNQQPKPLREIDATIPEPIEAIVMKTLNKDPQERPTAMLLSQQLVEFLNSEFNPEALPQFQGSIPSR